MAGTIGTPDGQGRLVAINEGGPRVAVDERSGKGFIEHDGDILRDLDGSGDYAPFKDWRLQPDERARDLAARLSDEDIIGLMFFSPHQMLVEDDSMFVGFSGGRTYGGVSREKAGCHAWNLSDQQREFLDSGRIRHVLVARIDDAETCARWNNEAQALAEASSFGIPVTLSTDPRHGAAIDAEYSSGGSSDISRWPDELGLAATFDPKLVWRYGHVVAAEYRALGITSALSPQIDLATEPRWARVMGTFGASPDLSVALARACVDGMQTSGKHGDFWGGWGFGSVNAMVKHWPGGGPEEGGRDAHFDYGKYAVYPGGAFETHLRPFVEGAFALGGPTRCASAVMPYYTCSWGQNGGTREQVGNAYNAYLIRDLLRGKCGYDDVVCTDWGVTGDCGPKVSSFTGKCWGMERAGSVDRFVKIIDAGVDQVGGSHDVDSLRAAWRQLEERDGKVAVRRRFESSAVRILRNVFRTGLFDNPYLDIERSKVTVGSPEFVRLGFEAQVKSIVMLKNHGSVLPMPPGSKVWIPKMHMAAHQDWFGNRISEHDYDPVPTSVVERYFQRVDSAAEADFALVFVSSPKSEGYSDGDLEAGGNGYIPITLQYRPYEAADSRESSLASDEEGDRSYRGKTCVAENESDLDSILDAREKMGEKPVVVASLMAKPAVVGEYEAQVDAILAHFGVQAHALLEVISGSAEPSGLCPVQFPANMAAVERHCEDVPFDIECYADEDGNSYDVGFGLNWSGRIEDERVRDFGHRQA